MPTENLLLKTQQPSRKELAKLLVVIVNYRTADLTIDCLRSLQREIDERGDTYVVVVDGDSGDDSPQKISSAIEDNAWSEWAEMRALDTNGGFAYGNNAGFAEVLSGDIAPQYVLLLNPDTIAKPRALTELVDFMDANPSAGIAGSRLENRDGTARFSAFRFASPWSEFESNIRLGLVSRLLQKYLINPPIQEQAHSTDWVAGASMIIRNQVFDDIGAMDPTYFLYYEETDFCLRAKRAGWSCHYVPTSRVIHLVGQSSGITGAGRTAKRVPAYWFASRRYYFQKNYGKITALMADSMWLLGYSLWTARRWLSRRPHIDPPKLGRDFIRWTLLN